jgi:hypothetical protein
VRRAHLQNWIRPRPATCAAAALRRGIERLPASGDGEIGTLAADNRLQIAKLFVIHLRLRRCQPSSQSQRAIERASELAVQRVAVAAQKARLQIYVHTCGVRRARERGNFIPKNISINLVEQINFKVDGGGEGGGARERNGRAWNIRCGSFEFECAIILTDWLAGWLGCWIWTRANVIAMNFYDQSWHSCRRRKFQWLALSGSHVKLPLEFISVSALFLLFTR